MIIGNCFNSENANEVMVIINEILDSLIEEEKNPDNIYITYHGFIYSLFVQADSRFDVLKQKIEIELKDEKFIEAMKHIIHVDLSKSVKEQYRKLSQDENDYIAKSSVIRATFNIDFLLKNNIFDYGNYIFEQYKLKHLESPHYNYIKDNYIYYLMIDVLFKLKKHEKIQNIDHTSSVFKIYVDASVILEDDVQYSKYSLVSICPSWLRYNTSEAYIYDPRIDKNFKLLHVPVELLIFLIGFVEKGYINELAVRPDSNSFQDGEIRISPFNEEVQFGKIFSFDEFRKIKITKLYSTNLNDSLWIVIDDYNITFEELINDFDITDNNEIVTQVVHMEYKCIDDNVEISHIDHEFIYYDFDEFEKRTQNYRQKGGARKREKTFKIDKSSIPFVLEDNTSLVYIILKSCFKNGELIDEYFMEVINNN